MTLQGQFSAELTVDQVLKQWPDVATVFLRYHMACVGCPMALFETLDSSTQIYKVPLDAFLKELELAAAHSN